MQALPAVLLTSFYLLVGTAAFALPPAPEADPGCLAALASSITGVYFFYRLARAQRSAGRK
jgi:hypothetical protein